MRTGQATDARPLDVNDPAIKAAFLRGWEKGYYDGGEHDCRMFTPTAERAWDDYVLERKLRMKGTR